MDEMLSWVLEYELCNAAKAGDIKTILERLKGGVDVNANQGRPLMLAVHNNHYDAARVLIVRGANPTLKDFQALKIAKKSNNRKLVKLIELAIDRRLYEKKRN